MLVSNHFEVYFCKLQTQDINLCNVTSARVSTVIRCATVHFASISTHYPYQFMEEPLKNNVLEKNKETRGLAACTQAVVQLRSIRYTPFELNVLH